MVEDKIAYLAQPEIQAFLKENAHVDPTSLLLRPLPQIKGHEKWIAEQLQSFQKAKGKIADWDIGQGWIMPSALSIEQSSGSLAAQYKKSILKTGTTWVDLTGGLGVDSLTVADKFQQKFYVEVQEELCAIFRHNQAKASAGFEIVHGKAEDFDFSALPRPITVYIDPSRRDSHANRVFRIEDCTPNIGLLKEKLAPWADVLLIKLSPMLDISQVIASLHPHELHIVAVNGECKEILVMWPFGCKDHTPTQIKGYEVRGERKISFSYFWKTSQEKPQRYSLPKRYLYDPSVIFHKAQNYAYLLDNLPVDKIAPNTHFFTSEELVADFPGRIFKIEQKVDKQHATKRTAQVISRNYPLSAQQIIRKWKITEGGNDFIIAGRDLHNTPFLLEARQIHLRDSRDSMGHGNHN